MYFKEAKDSLLETLRAGKGWCGKGLGSFFVLVGMMFDTNNLQFYHESMFDFD